MIRLLPTIMPLVVGTRLGPYEITAQIGVGGMGEVYRATDLTLERQVAIKVVPESLASDADRLGRFEREAKTLAALNHPNIAHIYGFEYANDTRALVMELVEGLTLADLLERGPIPPQEALPLAKQIAEALEAAHDRRIIHRDLKPANIKVRADGVVKVLDFGLAKAIEPTGATPDLSQSLTTSARPITLAGAIFGTPAYMSPEQARGQSVDERADIWAFGCVLYEMLAGTAPFLGRTGLDTLAHVLEHEPDWHALPADTPSAIRTLLRRCLEKDRQQRLPHIGAARLEIADAIALPGPGRVPVSSVRSRQRVVVLMLGALSIAAGVAWLAFSTWKQDRAVAPAIVSRVSINPSSGESWVISPHEPDFAIAPDGTRIAYLGRRADGDHLVVRRLDEFRGMSLGRFGGAVRHPFFSPDGKWVGFVDGNVLKKAAVDGSAVVAVCGLPGYVAGASWGADNVIVFATLNEGLFRVPSTGGQAEALPTSTLKEGGSGRWPEVLPEGRAVLYATVDRNGRSDIRARSLVSSEEWPIVTGATFPRYARSRHLLYVSDNVLWAVPFNAASLKLTGEAVPVVKGIMIKGPRQSGLGAADVAIAANGTLVYRSSGAAGDDMNTLVWVDRHGREEPAALQPRNYGRMQLSSDGSKVAIEVTDSSLTRTDIWVGDPRAGTLSQLTFGPGGAAFPVWTPDNRRVVFSSGRDGGGLYWTLADGTGGEEQLLGAAPRFSPYFVTPDGRGLVYIRPPGPPFPLFLLPLDGSHVERKLAAIPGPLAAISPDGKWLAQSTPETGNFEVYVQPYSNPNGARWRITTGGGRDPVWSRDGRGLFYQNGTTTFAVGVTTSPTFAAAAPVALFDGPYVDGIGRWYDVGPDGRFLLIKPGWLTVEPSSPLDVVLNWTEELKRLAPTR